jgi:hypothetical protein
VTDFRERELEALRDVEKAVVELLANDDLRREQAGCECECSWCRRRRALRDALAAVEGVRSVEGATRRFHEGGLG